MHSLGAAVGLSLEKQLKKEGNNPYGIIQSKSFGSPTVSSNISNPLFKKNIVKDETVTAGTAGMGYIGASTNSAIGFSDGGLLAGLGADIGKKVSTDFSNRITPDTNTSPDRIRYFGDPASMFDFSSTTVMPPMGFKWKNSSHSYKGLFVKDAVPTHDTIHNPLTPSPGDREATVVT